MKSYDGADSDCQVNGGKADSEFIADDPRGRHQHHRADGRDGDRSDRMVRMQSEQMKDDAADDAAHQAEQNVRNGAVAVSAHELARKPSGDQSHDNQSDHDLSPRVSIEQLRCPMRTSEVQASLT